MTFQSTNIIKSIFFQSSCPYLNSRKIKKVDIILLSHAAIQYTGALPYLFLELDCQVNLEVIFKYGLRLPYIQHCQSQTYLL